MDIKNMTVEEFIALKKSMDEAENDTTPFAIVENDQIQVVGDVSKTEVKKHDYRMQFYYRNNEANKKVIEENGIKLIKETPNYLIVEREYKDVWVSPRVHMAIHTAFLELYRFFVATNDDGELRDMTIDEIVEVMHMLDQQMIEAMCHAVATVLRIPPNEEELMVPEITVDCVAKMIRDFPEIINGVDFFTDRSSGTRA